MKDVSPVAPVNAAAIVRSTENKLEALAAAINAEQEKGDQAARNSLAHYRKVGELLLQAREKCLEAQQPWGKWLAAAGCNDRLARRYMQIAQGWAQIQESGRASGMSVRAALKELGRLGEEDAEPPSSIEVAAEAAEDRPARAALPAVGLSSKRATLAGPAETALVEAERERCIGLIRQYLMHDSQRAVYWHEVQDCVRAIQEAAAT